jgi:hypothetical protein
VIRPFIDFLREQRAGETEEELAKALNALVAAVSATDKKGKLVLTISVEPVKNTGTMLVSDEVTLKLPQLPRGRTMFYGTPENNLQRRDPRQMELPVLKEVKSDKPEPKEVAVAQ